MSGSTIPAALAGLTATFKSVAPAGCDVIYAYPYDVDTFWLAVGWDRTDQPSVTAANSNSDIGGVVGLEEYDISSLLSLAHGDQDLPTTVGNLFTAFNLFADALAANPTLSGAVERAQMADYDLTPAETETGDSAELRFTVHVEAFK